MQARLKTILPASEKAQRVERYVNLLSYVESSKNGREIIEFSNQGDADTAGHQIRDLAGSVLKVSIGPRRVVVERVRS